MDSIFSARDYYNAARELRRQLEEIASKYKVMEDGERPSSEDALERDESIEVKLQAAASNIEILRAFAATNRMNWLEPVDLLASQTSTHMSDLAMMAGEVAERAAVRTGEEDAQDQRRKAAAEVVRNPEASLERLKWYADYYRRGVELWDNTFRANDDGDRIDEPQDQFVENMKLAGRVVAHVARRWFGGVDAGLFHDIDDLTWWCIEEADPSTITHIEQLARRVLDRLVELEAGVCEQKVEQATASTNPASRGRAANWDIVLRAVEEVRGAVCRYRNIAWKLERAEEAAGWPEVENELSSIYLLVRRSLGFLVQWAGALKLEPDKSHWREGELPPEGDDRFAMQVLLDHAGDDPLADAELVDCAMREVATIARRTRWEQARTLEEESGDEKLAWVDARVEEVPNTPPVNDECDSATESHFNAMTDNDILEEAEENDLAMFGGLPLSNGGKVRLTIDAVNGVVSLNDAAHPVPPETAAFLQKITAKRGGWMSSREAKSGANSNERFDRRFRTLPEDVRDLFESEAGKGYRLKASEVEIADTPDTGHGGPVPPAANGSGSPMPNNGLSTPPQRES